jgi:hypothetical protein
MESPEINDPKQDPTLTDLVDLIGYDRISNLHFVNSKKPCVHFIHNESKFTISLERLQDGRETISVDVEINETNESLGFFTLSEFNYYEQVDLIVNTILDFE